MSARTPLASTDDCLHLGYDPMVVGPMLHRASARVRGHLRGRLAAAGLFAEPPVGTPELSEFVLAVAQRMASTSPQVAKGVQAETLSGGAVTWGAQAYAGLSDLTDTEKDRLDRMYPLGLRSVEVEPR